MNESLHGNSDPIREAGSRRRSGLRKRIMKNLAVVVTCVMALAGSAMADTAEDVVAWSQ
jgi:hypothetical protein